MERYRLQGLRQRWLAGRHINPISPLPWREGIEGRGNSQCSPSPQPSTHPGINPVKGEGGTKAGGLHVFPGISPKADEDE